jgi:starvation-inducible DNA-binding protein
MRPPHIGLSPRQCEGSIALLNVALCNESLLLIKTKKAHWDVVGPQFLAIHRVLDDDYAQLQESTDRLAERIRVLGGYPTGTASGFLEHATLREQPGELRGVTGIIEGLLQDHEAVIRQLREAADQTDVGYGDRGSSDTLVALLQKHEVMAWQLRSFLEGEAVQSDGRIEVPEGRLSALA